MKYLIVITIILASLKSNCSFGQTDTAHIEHPPNGHNSPYRKAIHLKLDEAKFRHIKSLNHHYVVVEGTFYRLDRGLGLITLELDVKGLKRLYLKTDAQL
ncbi:hypothetical protein JN11_01046 [Mucilaginibacter frigoritolerans]|uniref:Uncharacterized protein n=1 Tax=Mucilaginibacter frigoritolerans TaxID=652788 RepID=A0A562UCD5_9SPHI|nr:hypothetical protein [Mucilaginibacter frigoritolerans]TWJ03500.1 hypothetical protein JN11_01046 [Mucilaginibacter frigoritolerans]